MRFDVDGGDSCLAGQTRTVAQPTDATAEFVRSMTRRQAPELLPELPLLLADDMTVAWQAAEGRAGGACPPPWWAFAWLGGQALARWLLDDPEQVAGRTVYDLATGSGLVALAAATAGARQVTGVDIDPTAVTAARLNAAALGLAVTFEAADPLAGPPPACDLLLAGDVCYDRELAGRVTEWLAAATGAGARVVVGDPGRVYLPARGFVELASYEIPTDRELEGRTSAHVRVLELLPDRSPTTVTR